MADYKKPLEKALNVIGIWKKEFLIKANLEDVLVNSTRDDDAKVIPTNGEEKQKLVSILNNIHSSRLKISNFVLSIKVTIGRSRKIKKSLKNDQLKKVFPVNTLPPNLRDCSPPPSYKSGDNSLDDHNEASPSNDRDESDIGIDEDDDKNPFIKNGEGSRNNKVIINQYCQLLIQFYYEHAINSIDLNDASTNDCVADGHNISLDFRNFQLTSIKQLETNPTFSYLKDIE
ncbi:hypothetical protein RhiirA4_476002 [Rhizophagus irregularis]|uniref:Uncharacterized protein n=1 Tax=Rhizophagus irregularis TaxID=588596 RepID=A0A2I1HAV8_9GLOM|nr:hypothetical protein RhiirA4_476002 [Rhizophagus irregularis]